MKSLKAERKHNIWQWEEIKYNTRQNIKEELTHMKLEEVGHSCKHNKT